MKIFETEFKKNILNFKTKNNSNKTIKTIVYVGESTSALIWDYMVILLIPLHG